MNRSANTHGAAGADIPSLLALRHQLEESQWWSPDQLQHWQFEKLRDLLRHAYNTIPFYRRRIQAAGIDPKREVTYEQWMRLPILGRADVQRLGDVMVSQKIPTSHKPTAPILTSGSTGMPIRALTTRLTQQYWKALTLREHAWHNRDLSGKLAAIRAEGSDSVPKEGLTLPNWGAPTAEVYRTGPAARLSVQIDIADQAAWLLAQQPQYLISYPSNLLALARYCQHNNLSLPQLREVRCYGETVTQELRDACRLVWGVPVTDMYSAQEVGYLALQCPDHEHYHVQAESAFVEVLDSDNKPCAPGEIGRVVITTLHNYAMPLLRYEILDYAEAGAPCTCGRSLPVLNRIMGRQRNMLVLPNGKRSWPTFPVKAWAHIAPIRQLQLVQKTMDVIEVRLVSERPLHSKEEGALANVLRQRFGYPFEIVFTYMDRIERGQNYKFEDFISQVPST
jgi:phenylacetate-CoA ligase